MTNGKRSKLLVLIHGKKRSGKDFVAGLIREELEKEYCINSKRMALADKMKEMISALFDISLEDLEKYKNEELPIYIKEDEKLKEISNFRKILQRFGTEVMKKEFGKYIWVDLLKKEIEKTNEPVILVPDIRFSEELEGLSSYETYKIYIDSKNSNHQKDLHVSEKGLDKKLFCYYFDNTEKDPEKARNFAKKIAKQIFERLRN